MQQNGRNFDKEQSTRYSNAIQRYDAVNSKFDNVMRKSRSKFANPKKITNEKFQEI